MVGVYVVMYCRKGKCTSDNVGKRFWHNIYANKKSLYE